MTVFKRGNTYWFEFKFNGTRHRQSCKTANEEVALKIEREERRAVELGQVGLLDQRKSKQKFFGKELIAYIELMKPHWKKKTLLVYKTNFSYIYEFFGKMLLTDVTANTIQLYQVHRKEQLTKKKTPPSNATINCELGLVRQFLIHHKLWFQLKEGSKLRMLKQSEGVGVALTESELQRLLNACKESVNRALYPAVLLSIFTGLRSFELKGMKWKQIDLLTATLTVGKSKTNAGEGRKISLSPYALKLIMDWRSNFEAAPEHYVFPSERYARHGNKGLTRFKTSVDAPYISLYYSWDTARQLAGVKCRWHDLRHSCVSIVADSGASNATLKSMFGWISEKMIDHYSHSREQARRDAVQHVDSFMNKMLQSESIQ